ncbi:transcription factor DIVARICATA-like isoform X2 [Magnolia sinica]|uniref:transcription factor DIVARICATA-like isoform X2 n=1 Tax=Magnolia sinica TaxID=86752 RepID=UPI00265B3F69|nr:transcription factor DIVARICATA-like isoform X2 [Magnolia sinica]
MNLDMFLNSYGRGMASDFEIMKLGMEFLSPTSYLPYSNWLIDESNSSCANWTSEENKLFEEALAIFDKETHDRWQKIAARIPGKTVHEVKKHYKDLEDDVSVIEAGLIPIPGAKRSAGRPDQERKKGVPWTEEEHRQFLRGLQKYGKGDWRNISRNFVITKTPTQVASHAQKFFIRQCSGGKDKRRSSIHDITTASLTDNRPPSPSQSPALSVPHGSTGATKTPDQFSVLFDSNPPNKGATVFSPTASQACGNFFLPHHYGITPHEMKLQTQSFHRSLLQDPQSGPQNMVFQLQSSHHHPHG